MADHYHVGDTLNLQAEISPASELDHWHWLFRTESMEEWQTISGQGTSELSYPYLENNMEVIAVLYDANHQIVAESELQKVNVTNSDEDASNQTEQVSGISEENEEVTIVGLGDHYHSGDIVTLRAESNQEVGAWQWLRRYEMGEWEPIEDHSSETLEQEIISQDIEFKVQALDNDGEIIGESESVLAHVDNHENLDPHIWLDPILAQTQVNHIRDALIEADPEGEVVYTENAATFNSELQSLHEEYVTALADAENRSFVVQHQAFGYLAQRYNLHQIAVGGLSTEVEPSPARLAEITEIVRELGVPVIYYQQGANSDIAQIIAAETGTESAQLFDLETQSPQMQEDGIDYLNAMRLNLEALQLSIK